MQVIAWRTVFEMSYNVSSGTLNLTHSLTFAAAHVAPGSCRIGLIRFWLDGTQGV